MLINRRKNHFLLYENWTVLKLNKHESPSSKEALCQVWLKLAQWFLIRRLFNFVNAFSLFRSYLPFEKGGAPHLNKFESPLPNDALCQTLLKLTQWFWRERFLIFVNVLLLLGNYLPLENGGALHLNNLESSSPKDALCQVWLKLAQWFLRRWFFIFVNVFSLFRNYLPLEKSVNLHLIKLKPPSPRMLCAKLKLAQWFWRGRKCEKFTTTTTMTSNGQFFSEKLTWAERRNIFFVFF